MWISETRESKRFRNSLLISLKINEFAIVGLGEARGLIESLCYLAFRPLGVQHTHARCLASSYRGTELHVHVVVVGVGVPSSMRRLAPFVCCS